MYRRFEKSKKKKKNTQNLLPSIQKKDKTYQKDTNSIPNGKKIPKEKTIRRF